MARAMQGTEGPFQPFSGSIFILGEMSSAHKHWDVTVGHCSASVIEGQSQVAVHRMTSTIEQQDAQLQGYFFFFLQSIKTKTRKTGSPKKRSGQWEIHQGTMMEGKTTEKGDSRA